MERSAERQAEVEKGLREASKESKASYAQEHYLRTGEYRKDRTKYAQDRANLEKRIANATKRIAKGKTHGYAGKIAKFGKLMKLMNENTNIEEEYKAAQAQEQFAENIQQEMLEGENAVAAVANAEAEEAAAFVSQVPVSGQVVPLLQPLGEEAAAPNNQVPVSGQVVPLLLPLGEEAAGAAPNNHVPVSGQVVPLLPPEESQPCDELFDPCTREPIPNGDIAALERRVREIKAIKQHKLEEAAVFPPEIQNRLQLLLALLNRDTRPDETLLEYSINGQLYEAYWDIVFAFGLMDEFPLKPDFYMYSGKVEELVDINDPRFVQNTLQYLESKKVNEGSKSGASDITFVYKSSQIDPEADACSAIEAPAGDVKLPLFYFCSSKYFKEDSKKGVDKFDIQNIYTAAKNLKEDAYERKIILLVKDRGAVEEKLRKALRKYIAEEARFVFGMSDLFAALTKLFDYVRSKVAHPITKEHLAALFGIAAQQKPLLSLRLHQHMATIKIASAIRRFRSSHLRASPVGLGGSNRFLVGIVPRGGKTYIAAGIVDALRPRRVVVLLGAWSETNTQFKEDLFDLFQNFSDYECIRVLESSNVVIDPRKKYIFLMSVELFKMPKTQRELLTRLKGGDLRADLFICDEAHLKQITQNMAAAMGAAAAAAAAEEEASDHDEEKQLETLDAQISKEVPIVYMTGTYIKPLKALQIPTENTIIWDYQDIQQAKELPTNEAYFRENFGELYETALAKCISYGETLESIQAMYRKFPELYLLTTQFSEDAKEAFLKQSGAGFPTITHLFQVRKDFNPATQPELWHTGFMNPKGMQRLLNYLAPSRSAVIEEGVEPIHSVLTSIDHIAQRIGDRLRFFTSEFVPHSQLWFLPSMQGHSLFKRFCALAGSIFQNEWFKRNFHVIAVSSSVDWSVIQGAQGASVNVNGGHFTWACPNPRKSLKQCLIEQEAVARHAKKGLIILAQNMLHLGISLPCVDIVVLLDSGEKIDERIQKMYRALTESTNKRGGFIVDMNYFRTVTAIMNYVIATEVARKGAKPVAEDIPKLFHNGVLDIFSIDDDNSNATFREQVERETLPELIKQLGRPSKGEDSLQIEEAATLLNRNISGTVSSLYSASFEDFLGQLKEEADKKVVRKEGENVVAAAAEASNSSSNDEASEPPEILPAAAKTDAQKRAAFIEIFKTALKLGAFGTNASDIRSFITELDTNANGMRQILYDTLIKRGLVTTTGNAEEKQTYLIEQIIVPGLEKLIESNRNSSYSQMKRAVNNDDKYPAEVTKVLEYINTHLAPKDAERQAFGEVFTPMKLVHEMLDTLPADVWTDKDLTWLDPANGMGNFPIAVFLRLYYGFRTMDGTYSGLTENGPGDFNPGLTKAIPNPTSRSKHIVEKMLFMIELNPKNIAISKRLFQKLAPSVDPNIIRLHPKLGFFGTGELKFPNGTVSDFDIIMGNPPFNPPKTASGSSGNSIWPNFVIKSFYLLKDKGYLLFVHPPGWKKPTDEVFKPERFADKDFTKQIRQGLVWQVLKDAGNFKYIYTNDQRSKSLEEDYLPHFPAVDYYLYQKGGERSTCETFNIFLGKVVKTASVRLNYNLSYLPNLITKQTQDILQKVTSKEGEKPEFKAGFDPRGFRTKEKGDVKYIYDASPKGPNYAFHKEEIPNVNISKIVLNENGGINSFYCQYIDKSEHTGVLHHTLLFPVERELGKRIEKFFNSDLVKFIFLITQYTSGKMTTNEKLVANSLTIPPEGVEDYYDFFDIKEHKEYIESLMHYYDAFKTPKRTAAKSVKKGGGGGKRKTRKLRR